MLWNWEQPDWPNFSWDRTRLVQAEEQFLHGTGVLIGSAKHLGDDDRTRLIVEGMSGEAVTTSEIEGEILNRASVQSSIQRQLGIATDRRRIAPAEQGISELMVDHYRTVPEPLTEGMLSGWHRMTMSGRRDLNDVGRYRTSAEPMQVVSSVMHEPKVHFEAPPSQRVPAEMA
jgi:Fic family protein